MPAEPGAGHDAVLDALLCIPQFSQHTAEQRTLFDGIILGACSVELANGPGSQVGHHIDGEADVANCQAQHDIDRAFGISWMFGSGFRMIDGPVHCLQAFRAVILGGQAIIQTEEDLLGCALCIGGFKCRFDQMLPQRCANVVGLPGGFTEGVSDRLWTGIADDVTIQCRQRFAALRGDQAIGNLSGMAALRCVQR
jgi:hypothetical protein